MAVLETVGIGLALLVLTVLAFGPALMEITAARPERQADERVVPVGR